VKNVVCLGEGAGANIVARFAVSIPIKGLLLPLYCGPILSDCDWLHFGFDVSICTILLLKQKSDFNRIFEYTLTSIGL